MRNNGLPIGILVVLLAGCAESGDQASGDRLSEGGVSSGGALSDRTVGSGGGGGTGGSQAVGFESGAEQGRASLQDSGSAAGSSGSAIDRFDASVPNGQVEGGDAPSTSDAAVLSDAKAQVPDEVTLVPDPSWTCGMPDGIPPPEGGELVFRATLQLGVMHDVGATQYGQRRVLDVKGGTLKGERLEATVLSGGFEFELTLANGSLELEQIDMLRTSDGKLVYLRSCGVAAPGSAKVRIVPDFEVATSSSWAWLNTGKFAGTRVVNAAAGTIDLAIYDVSRLAPSEPRVSLADPAGIPNQPWECSTKTGAKGASVFSEAVTLGSSLAVGASKRGTRNVIPITGGTITGRVTGSVVSGGADYQLIGATTTLDARYVLSSNDGEFVVVRNCGPTGALVPLFETRATGPYAFLNANNFVSSDPGSASGGVGITFYERK